MNNTDKQPQTCYIEVKSGEWDEFFLLEKLSERHAKKPMLNGITAYIHTHEELEVKIEITDNYFPVQCQTCGWFGSSENLNGGHAIADTGDHDDCYCPVCGQVDPDECEEKLPISAYKNAYEKMSALLIESKRLHDEQHWRHLSDNINQTEELVALKAKWMREAAEKAWDEGVESANQNNSAQRDYQAGVDDCPYYSQIDFELTDKDKSKYLDQHYPLPQPINTNL